MGKLWGIRTLGNQNFKVVFIGRWVLLRGEIGEMQSDPSFCCSSLFAGPVLLDMYCFYRTLCFAVGFNRDGYNKQGYNRLGYDRYGYNVSGLSRYGYDNEGWSKENIQDLSGRYDPYGFDMDCLDRRGKFL